MIREYGEKTHKSSKNELAENKAQRWRAYAIFDDNSEGLIYIGNSYAAVNENYDRSWFDIYDDMERGRIKEIQLQKWNGLPDKGRWVYQKSLTIPQRILLPITTKSSV